MANLSTSGTVNLEKELNCAICTEILYQPLTLLDCLHTFCGSCLKLWFPVQAAQASSSRGNPYTCPTCRKSVRATSSDAKINTLLEMYLLANPDKVKSSDEKKEIAKKYTRGENVIPKRPERRREDDGGSDRRMVEEVREMNLRDSNSRNNRHGYERGVRHRQRSREERRDGTQPGESAESSAQARHIEHQSSLRSLISTEELDSNEMVEEILRQISQEGLLDGVDTHNLDATQLDEVSERIAVAYRRRHGRGRSSPSSRPSSSRRDGPSPSTVSRTRRTSSRPNSSGRSDTSASESITEANSTRQNARPVSATEESRASNPPVSRPHLLEAEAALASTRRRRSNESRRQTSPNPRTGSIPPQATRSATDLSTYHSSTVSNSARTGSEFSPRIDMNARNRRQSDTEERLRAVGPQSSPRTSHLNVFPRSNSEMVSQRPGGNRSSGNRPSTIEISQARVSSAPTTPRIVTPNQTHQPSHGSPLIAAAGTDYIDRPNLHSEISVHCDRCGKKNIEYDLHEHCSICRDGNYNLCHTCYRESKGCLHWFGFGDQAWHRFQRSASQQHPPHALVSHRYARSQPESIQIHTDGRSMTSEEPSIRLEAGAFCSRCQAFADDCFWKCKECNNGEWGYCNQCVNTGHCCTHPLLPLANVSSPRSTSSFVSNHPEASFAPVTSTSMVQVYPPTNINSSPQYRPLTFSTTCNICHYPIQPSQSRFHCYTCSNGDYDICGTCYARLVDTGRISRANSDKGWRRCLKDHRMVKVWFKDSQHGQQRVIENDLVGGCFLEDRQQQQGEWSWVDGGQRRTKTLSQRMFDDDNNNSNSSDNNNNNNQAPDPSKDVMLQKFLPDGGVGLHVRALHPWLPKPDSKDELAFPRGAEIREVWEMDDWLLGSYAGDKGLFPRNHVVVLRQVTM